MKITIHRGTHQIGGCVTEYDHEGWRLFVDYGEELPGNPNTGDLLIEGLTHGNLSKSALLITHYHGDHIGRITRLPKELPIYISSIGRAIQIHLSKQIKRNDDHKKMVERLSTNPYTVSFEAGKAFSFGPFNVLPITLDHSAFEANAFRIEVGSKSFFHTGDFRTHGFRSKKHSLLFNKLVGKVDYVVCEATNVMRQNTTNLSEQGLHQQFIESFKENHGNIVYVSSTNIDRLFSLYNAAIEANCIFIVDEYQKSMMELVCESNSVWTKSKYYNFKPESMPIELKCYKGKLKVYGKFEWLLKHKGYVLLARASSHFDNLIKLMPGNKKNYLSMWNGYVIEGNPAYNERLTQSLGKDYKYMHTSGHCDMISLRKVLEILQPKMVIPIHTDNPEEFEKQFGDKWSVKVLNDGESIEC